MNTTKTNDRAAEIRAALQSATAELRAAREALGASIADGDERAATEARSEVVRLERLTGELSAALPVIDRRMAEAAAKEAAKRRAEQEKAANKNRKARIEAAKRVDSAMAALGREVDRLLALDTGGTSDNRAHVIRRQRYSARGAFALHAPTLARVLEVPVIPSAHRRPLAESESGLIHEFPEVEVEVE